MKKLYLLLLAICIAGLSFGQIKVNDPTLAGSNVQLEKRPMVKSSFVQNDIKEKFAAISNDQVVFSYTGAPQEFIVPSGVTKVFIEAYGAQGGTAQNNIDYFSCGNLGGLGGFASGYLDVTPGESLWVYVGGQGLSGNNGGWNGGGSVPDISSCGKGGGASDVRQSGVTLFDRVIVAAGGGGSEYSGCNGTGGNGGGLIGDDGSESYDFNGKGGTQNSGGAGSVSYSFQPSNPGSFGYGGDGVDPVGHQGSGGGGWYGGGAGAPDGNGGGGSSYIELVSDSITTSGINSGDGIVNISWSLCFENIVADNDPGQCGAVVNYTQPDAWAGATVTQVDVSGLTSGDEFPVGVTTQSYELVWDGGTQEFAVAEKSAALVGPSYLVDTCTFTVTVNDTELPEIQCKNITVQLGSGGSGNNVLLLWDENNTNTQSLKAAIEAEGFTVTMPSVPEYQWDNTNPPLDGFDAVVHLDGTTYESPLSLTAQNALVDFVTVQGKAFVHAEWDAFEIDDEHRQDAMSEIIILQRYSGIMGDLTYTMVSGQENHPVLEGLPNSFTISYVGYSPSNLRSYATNPAEMLMTDQHGTAAVAIRDFGEGKVVGFNHAGNYRGSNALSDLNVQKLYTNALKWGTQGNIAVITPAMLLNSGTDNCGIQSMTVSKDTFTIEDIGPNTVTLTVTDVNGNSSTCNSIVTVITDNDNTKPTIKCNPIDIYLDKDGQYVLTPEDKLKVSEGTTDDVDAYEDLEITVIKGEYAFDFAETGTIDFTVDFNCEDIGKDNTVDVFAVDKAGNMSFCWAFVNVVDSFPFMMDPIADLIIELDSGVCETQIDYPEIVQLNACTNVVSQTAGLGPDGIFPAGTTTETWMAINVSGDTTTLSFNVIVVAVNELPTLDPIADIAITEGVDTMEVILTGISYGIDCLGQDLTISAIGTDTMLITDIAVDYISPDSTGTLRLVLAPEMTGTDTITVMVSDGDTAIMQSFVITVNQMNHAPSLVNSILDTMTIADEELKIAVSATLGSVFDDEDGDALTLSFSTEDGGDIPAWMTIDGDTLVCTPTVADTGCVSIVVTATDLAFETSTDTFTVCVEGTVKAANFVTSAFDVDASVLDVQMYPNPTRDMVNLKINASQIMDSEVIVRTITGSEVFRKEYRAAELINIDLSENVTGFYLVMVKSGDRSVIKKLILDRK